MNKESIYLLLLISFLSIPTNAQKDKKIINSIIAKYFHAIGGKERARQIHSYSSKASGILNEKEIILHKKMMLPNLFTTSLDYHGKIISKSIFDGKNGINLQQGEEINFTPEELKRHKNNRSIFPEFDYPETAKYLGTEKVNLTECHVLKVGNSKIYYSTSSGLKIKGVSIQEKDETAFLQQLYFGNYLEIKGLLFPTNLLMIAGKNEIEFQTRTILINRDVSKKDFKITN